MAKCERGPGRGLVVDVVLLLREGAVLIRRRRRRPRPILYSLSISFDYLLFIIIPLAASSQILPSPRQPGQDIIIAMPSFLSKVFGRKKDEKEPSNSKRHSTGSLLEGKFEAVSPTVSPTAFNFIESAQQLQPPREKDIGFNLFRPKSKTSPKPQDANKTSSPAPLLTLNLPVPKEDKSRALGVVFEADPNGRSTLSNSQIGERRLTPLETLLLVKACATAIIERGGEFSIVFYCLVVLFGCRIAFSSSTSFVPCIRT